MTTIDNFLDGQLKIQQPEKGYRAGIDAVLLAASVAPKDGQSVLDIGAGVGVVSLCIAKLNPKVSVQGLELDPEITKMAQHNIAANNLTSRVKILQGDLTNPPLELEPNSFDHVVSNPPYFNYGREALSQDTYKAQAKHSGLSLEDWVLDCLRMVKPRGYLTIIHRVDHLDELIVACKRKPVGLKVLPLQKDAKTSSKLVLLQVRKSVKTHFALMKPFILHEDTERYTPAADAIFRGRAKLPWG